ncbi:MAG: ABC transporter permease [Alphaproteobacteria bacterium]|nr:MAG: iron ABC transporter permease [Alphaproteobacteria bacterium]
MTSFIKNSWAYFSVILSLIVIIPILTIFLFLFNTGDDTWLHLKNTVLTTYILNSLILLIFSALGTLILGVITAWLVTMYIFPMKKYIEWLLVLPLAIPSYALAYVYSDLLSYSGYLILIFSYITNYEINSINFYSIYGAIFVFIFSLYPYVYLLARQAFIAQSGTYIEVAKVSGLNLLSIFYKVAIPLARPALVGGVILVVMETLADYGVADYLGIETFTKGIYKAWFNLGDIVSAGKLSIILLITISIIISLEKALRGKAEFTNNTRSSRGFKYFSLNRYLGFTALIICCIPVCIGFFIPITTIILWSIKSINNIDLYNFIQLFISSFSLALLAAFICILFAILIIYGVRTNSKIAAPFARIASLGYSIPGAVAAVAVLIPLAWIDNIISNFALQYFNISIGLLLTGSWFALLFAYLVRFLALSMHSVENSFIKIPISFDYAAKVLGKSNSSILSNIHARIGLGGISLGLLIVFVDVLKELPATMILRPFGLSTLAIKAHEFAIDERLGDAAIPLLAIVVVCLLPLFILARGIRH